MSESKNKSLEIVAFAGFLLAVVALGLHFFHPFNSSKKIAFVDTQRLLTAMKEAHIVNKEIEAKDKKMRSDIQTMEDSLKAFMDSMTVHYDNAPVAEKRKMQDELAMRNQQINNYTRHQQKKLQELTGEKMAGVYSKIDVFLEEYGKKHNYDIIFGTAQGSILYGSSTPADITNEVITAINERYE